MGFTFAIHLFLITLWRRFVNARFYREQAEAKAAAEAAAEAKAKAKARQKSEKATGVDWEGVERQEGKVEEQGPTPPPSTRRLLLFCGPRRTLKPAKFFAWPKSLLCASLNLLT